MRNDVEATLIHDLCTALLACGAQGVSMVNATITLSSTASSIGIISPYSYQLKAIRGSLDQEKYKDIEINTIDKYQGGMS